MDSDIRAVFHPFKGVEFRFASKLIRGDRYVRREFLEEGVGTGWIFEDPSTGCKFPFRVYLYPYPRAASSRINLYQRNFWSRLYPTATLLPPSLEIRCRGIARPNVSRKVLFQRNCSNRRRTVSLNNYFPPVSYSN